MECIRTFAYVCRYVHIIEEFNSSLQKKNVHNYAKNSGMDNAWQRPQPIGSRKNLQPIGCGSTETLSWQGFDGFHYGPEIVFVNKPWNRLLVNSDSVSESTAGRVDSSELLCFHEEKIDKNRL